GKDPADRLVALPASKNGAEHHRIGRDLQNLSRLFDAEAPKESQLHHSTLPRIHQRQAFQCIIQSQEVGVGLRSYDQTLVKINAGRSSSSFLITARSREVDENASHQLRTNRHEMSSILPFDFPNIHQAEISLVDESRRLECVSEALTDHVTAGGRVQLLVDQGY